MSQTKETKPELPFCTAHIVFMAILGIVFWWFNDKHPIPFGTYMLFPGAMLAINEVVLKIYKNAQLAARQALEAADKGNAH